MKCPFCGEISKPEEIKCRFCGEWLNKNKHHPNKKVSLFKTNFKIPTFILYPLLIILILFIVILIRETYLKFNDYKVNSSSPTPTVVLNLDENKLWNMINEWEEKQGFQSYTKDENLCKAGDFLLSNPSILNNSKDWFKKTNLNQSYYFSGFNTASSFNFEEAVFNFWITDKVNFKNLKDTYFKYSCIKCQKLNCIQMFANISGQAIENKQQQNSSNEEWGKVKQTGKVTFESRFNSDSRMATSQEIFDAINNYRRSNGKNSVSWDGDLASWAQSRAQLYANINNTDAHAGFTADAQSKYDQFKRFKGFSENSAFGGKLEAVHLIEWTFAQDEPHRNVLLCDCSFLGVGVASNDGNNYGVDLIFGK